MDIRWVARKIMHPDTEIVTVIKGHIFHQYNRVKQMNELFQQQQYQNLIGSLFERKDKRNNFIELAKTDPQYRNARPTDQLAYDAICQLDFVKIQIPVRHKDCKHARCYELTSLLSYKKEILISDPNKKSIECLCNCQVKFNLNTLEQDLVLDHQLLEAIRKSLPHTIKFYFNRQNNELIDEYSKNSNQDHYIFESYKKGNKLVDLKPYIEFEKEVFTILKDIYQRKLSDLDKGDGKKVLAQSKLYEFQDQNYNLEDPFLKSKAIEYPVRCVCCSFDKCSDIRTYIGNFLLNKKKQQTGKLDKQQKFQCPLCSKTFSKTYESLLNHQFQDYIYLDQNLLKRLLEHKEYINTKIFKYEGRQYMLDEFKKRHKIFAADVKEQCEQYQTEYMEYDNLNCIVTGKRLKIPLQLYKCPQKKYIDFYVFYEEDKKTGYDLAKGVVLCECQTCSGQPIVSINDIFFDEFFYLALNKLQNYETFSRKTEKKILINVQTEELVGIQRIPNKDELAFIQTLNKQQYDFFKNYFKNMNQEQQDFCENYFQNNRNQNGNIDNINQSQGQISIIVNQDNIQCDITDAQADTLNKFSFNVANLKIDVQNTNQKQNFAMNFNIGQ